MERGFAVHSINPKQLDRSRTGHSPAGAKDDRRDAWVLRRRCARIRTACGGCRRRWAEREWSRLAEDLTCERTRQANRMREQLWRYYAQFLDAVGDIAVACWKSPPRKIDIFSISMCRLRAS